MTRTTERLADRIARALNDLHDCLTAEAAQYHAAMKGYRPEQHAAKAKAVTDCADLIAAYDASRAEGGAPAVLWCMHIIGPDDVHPAPSKAHAEQAATSFNANFPTLDAIYVMCKAVAAPWPHSAESHAEEVEKFCENWMTGYAAPTPAPQGRVVADDGYVMVPRLMHVSPENWDAVKFQVGGPGEDEFLPGTIWVGDIEDDDGNKTHGLHVSCDEYPEEGSSTIATFPAYSAPTNATACPCKLATCVEPWDPGCGLGTTKEHAVPVSAKAGDDLAAANARGDGWRDRFNSDTDLIVSLQNELSRVAMLETVNREECRRQQKMLIDARDVLRSILAHEMDFSEPIAALKPKAWKVLEEIYVLYPSSVKALAHPVAAKAGES